MNSVISSARETADHAADAIKDTGGSMKGSLIDLGAQILRLYNHARVAEMQGVDSVLHRVGLQRRSSPVVPAALWFAAGAAVAGGVALVLAPTSGKELRRKLGTFLLKAEKSELVQTVVKEAKQIEGTIESAISPPKKAETDGHTRTRTS